jgi:hypothetical protein
MMFFVFEHGNPQDGEASGGLGDMKHKCSTLSDAQLFATNNRRLDDVEILDGQTGDVWFIDSRSREWVASLGDGT